MSNNERVFLIGVTWGDESTEHFNESMEELRQLAETSGCEVVDTFYQASKRPNTATYVGKGKLQEIKKAATNSHVNTLIFNNNLFPSQSLLQFIGI